jgi:hypothetical protein
MSRPPRDRIGATRGKLALVGVLAMVLAGVLVRNFGGGGQELAQVDGAAAPRASSTAKATPAGGSEPVPNQKSYNPFGEFAADRDWPTISLDKIISFDPLAAPPWAAAAEQAEAAANGEPEAKSLEELRTAANAIIFIADGQRVARIGDQEYHVGDRVGRYEITDISSAGIVLSEPAEGAGDP